MKNIISFLFIIAMLCMAVQCDRNCTQCEQEKAVLQQRVATLSQQLQNCNMAQVANQAKIDNLTQQLADCNSESQKNKAKIILLTQQLQECQSGDCQAQLIACQEQDALNQANIAELTTMLETCNTENDVNKAKIVVLSQQLSACNSEKTILTQQLQDCNSQITVLTQQLAVCSAANTANQAKIIDLTNQLAASNSQNTALTQQLNACNATNVVNQAKITDLTNQLNTCNTEKTTLTNQLNTCNSDKTTLTNQLAICNATNTANQAKITDLTNQLATCNAVNTANLAKITTLTNQLNTCNSDKTTLTNQLATCNATNTANQAKIADLTNQLAVCNATNTANQAKIADLNQQITTLNLQIAVLNQQLNASKTENTALKAQIILLNKDIQTYKDSLENCGGTGTARLWAYTYNLPNDSTVFNFWYSSEVSAPYQTKTSVGNLEFDQYCKVNGYERMYNKSSYTLKAGAAYLDIIIYDSTFTKVLYNGQFDIIQMLPKTEYKFEWNTGNFTLPYLGKYYMSKVLYEKKTFRNRPLEGGYFIFTTTDNLHTMLKMKTYPETKVKNIPNMKLYVNADTIYFPVKLDKVDSTYVVYINKSFDDIDSLKFTADTNLILNSAFLSSMNLLNNPTIKVKGLTKVNGIYKILVAPPIPPVVNPLVARWRFEQNGNDEMGKYPATISNPVNMYAKDYPIEGVYYLSTDGSSYTAVTPAIPLGNEFSISLYYRTWNQNDGMPITGNSKVYYPDGCILYADGVTSKMFRFVTSDGTSNNRKYIMSVDNVWVRATWVHIIITGSRTNAALGKMYINGVDKTRGSSTGIFQTFKTNLPLYIGKSVDSQGWCYVDDVRIYNRVLTAAEAAKLYSTGDIK